MKNLTFLLVTVAGCLGVESASAADISTYIQGNNCIPIAKIQTPSGTVSAAAGYSQYGVNAFEIPLDVICPISQAYKSYEFAYLKIAGYNRSFNDALFCVLMATSNDGVQQWPVVTATLALNGQPWQVSTYNNGYVGGPFSMYLKCHIPAQTSAGQSHLTGIFLRLFSADNDPPANPQPF